jgi:hypothetical protein
MPDGQDQKIDDHGANIDIPIKIKMGEQNRLLVVLEWRYWLWPS